MPPICAEWVSCLSTKILIRSRLPIRCMRVNSSDRSVRLFVTRALCTHSFKQFMDNSSRFSEASADSSFNFISAEFFCCATVVDMCMKTIIAAINISLFISRWWCSMSIYIQTITLLFISISEQPTVETEPLRRRYCEQSGHVLHQFDVNRCKSHRIYMWLRDSSIWLLVMTHCDLAACLLVCACGVCRRWISNLAINTLKSILMKI